MIHEKLYSATYSGVPVYEFIHPKSSVMRRKKDGWVNATHILKVANFPKARRTRILERDVQTGIHEKVQGGYGKYQGTWVPLERAVEIAKEYDVLNDLSPVFEYVSNGSMTPPPAPKHHHASSGTGSRRGRGGAKASRVSSVGSPSKIKPRKGNTTINTAIDNKPTNSSSLTSLNFNNSNLTPTSATRDTPVSLSATSENNDNNGLDLQNALKSSIKNSNDSNKPKRQRKRTLKPPKQTIPFTAASSGSDSSPFIESDNENVNDNDKLDHHNGHNHNKIKDDKSSLSDFMSDEDLDKALAESETYGRGNFISQESTFPTYKYQQQQQQQHLQNQAQNQAIQERMNHNEVAQRNFTQKLVEYFLSTEENPNIELPRFITRQYEDFDINRPIDKEGNTTLHWACAMGDLKMCQSLLARGCNIRVLNNKGEIPIFRSVMYTNSYTRRTFNKLLDLLSDALLDPDNLGHSLLHHIAISTASKNNLPSARYYTELLLTKIAESVQSSENFIEFINKQDQEGNTALHIMSFNGAKKCIKVLLGYNARVDIPNFRNELVSDYLNENFMGAISTATGPSLAATNSQYEVSQFQNSQGINSAYIDSFNNMRPFNPTLSHHPSLINAGPNFAETEMNNNNFGQSVVGGNGSVYLNVPHISEAAMQISQHSTDIMDKLGELSNAFDVELSQKEGDVKELSSIVLQMENDLSKTDKDIKEVLKGLLGNENLTDNVNDSIGVEMVREQAREVENEYEARTGNLKRLIERSQAMDLAKIVQKCETEELNEQLKENKLKPSERNYETMILVLRLIKLQMIRKRTVEILVNLYADASENTETIDKYRRLVSKLSNMPIADVDESLDCIEECLKNDNT